MDVFCILGHFEPIFDIFTPEACKKPKFSQNKQIFCGAFKFRLALQNLRIYGLSMPIVSGKIKLFKNLKTTTRENEFTPA